MPAPRGNARESAAAPISGGEAMTEASEWIGRVGTSWSDEWRRTDRSFGALTDRLLDDDAIGGFASALDIGCGAGELALDLARGHGESRVRGIDISAALLAVARERGEGLPNLAFEEADAARWQPDRHDRPDLLISRHGVMFFPDPVGAFAHLSRQAAPGARLRFSCFRPRADNAWAGALGSVLETPNAPPDPDAPGPFAFGDRAKVARILSDAGWAELALEAIDYAMIASLETTDRDQAVEDALGYFLRIGPAARALAELPPEGRHPAMARLRAVLADHYDGSRVAMPAAAWIVTARAA